MHSSSTALSGHLSNGPQDRNGAALSTAGSKQADGWILSLDLVGPNRLLATLSDGLWGREVAVAPWPPTAAAALPEVITSALQRLQGARLQLQLCSALDVWHWERELASVLDPGRLVPRYLTDLPEPAHAMPVAAPLVAPQEGPNTHLALVQAARMMQRPVVLVDADLPITQRLALEYCLRSQWRDTRLLSQALALAVAQLGLPLDCCRLYGDGRMQPADAEQGWRPVTAVRIDLVNSTLLLQSLGAEDYARRLQAYHERCREVILRFQGSLDVPQGDDGLMAYFGFPLAVEDAAARALTAAWQLSNGMVDLSLQVRIGVASGQVAVSAQQAFGSEVHLAARLCTAALPGRIWVAPSTRDRVGPGFALERVRELPILKDFAQLKSVYQLEALRPSAFGGVPRSGGAGNFVGRHRELELLREAWTAASGGDRRWCLVQGEAGIGKSRLLKEFSRELRAQGQRCLELLGQAQAGSSPYAAVVDALRQHWAIDPEVDATQLRERLASLLPPRRHQAEDLGELVRLLVFSHGEDLPSATSGQRHWGDLLLDCLLAVMEPGPFCLLVDDAHWLDPSSIELLRRLRDGDEGRLLLVVMGERIASGRAATLSSVAPIELARLSEDESRELALQLGAALPERVRQRAVARAEGVPLYLEESLRMLSHRDVEADGDMPATLEDLLMVRLDELGPDRALAQLVSVLGREFSAAHLEALLEQNDPFVERARQQGSLSSLLGSGLLQALESALPSYRFKHALIRDAAYASMWTDERTRLHGLCADLIENITPELGRQRPEQLAHHLQAAGRLEPALRAWLSAAHLAAARHAHQETLDLALRALALIDQLRDEAQRARATMQQQLLIASAQIALQGYGSAEVESAYQAAERAGSLLADSAHSLRIRLGLEACYAMRGDLPRAEDLARTCVAATSWTQDARLALQSRWALANVCFHKGDWAAALAGFDDCLAHYKLDLHRGSGVQDPAIMCLGYSSWIQFELGHADEAMRRIARMLALAQTLQHPFSSAVALGFAASMKRLCGDSDAAWPHAQDAVRVCERGGFKVWLAHAWMVSGQLRSDRGDVSGGAEEMERGYSLWVGGGARISCATYLITRAELLLRQGQTGRAADHLGQAWQISEQIGEHYYQAELLRLQGLCAWQAGDPALAHMTLERSLELAQSQHKPGLALRCGLSLGALQAARGQPQAAAQRMQGLLEGLSAHSSCRDDRWSRHALRCWEAGQVFDSLEHTPGEPL